MISFIIAIALIGNPWVGPNNDWQPLYDRYSYCQTLQPPALVRLCMAEAHRIATSDIRDA